MKTVITSEPTFMKFVRLMIQDELSTNAGQVSFIEMKVKFIGGSDQLIKEYIPEVYSLMSPVIKLKDVCCLTQLGRRLYQHVGYYRNNEVPKINYNLALRREEGMSIAYYQYVNGRFKLTNEDYDFMMSEIEKYLPLFSEHLEIVKTHYYNKAFKLFDD